jgi:hypothetical protein
VPASFFWHGTVDTDASNASNWFIVADPNGPGGGPSLPPAPGPIGTIPFSIGNATTGTLPSNTIPGIDDDVFFDGMQLMTNIDSVINTPAQFKSIHLVNGYSGTVSLANTLTVQTFEMRSRNIAQIGADSMYRQITVTNQFDWSGGVLNSSANAGTVTLQGANGTIDPMDGELLANNQFVMASDETSGSALGIGQGIVDFINNSVHVLYDSVLFQIAGPGLT